MVNTHPNHVIVIRQITSTEEFQSLEAEWKRLLRESNQQSAFLTWEWLFSWWQVFQKKNQLWLLTARENQDLVAIMPLMLSRQKKNGLTFRVLHPLGSPQCDVSGIIARDNRKEIYTSFGEFLVLQRKHWDILELNHYLCDDISLSVLKPFMEESGYTTTEKIYDHFYIPIEGEWENFFNNLSKKFRKNLRRASRLINDSGQVSFEHYKEKEATWSMFRKIIEINRHAHYPLIYNSQDEQAFHKILFERMSSDNMISLFLLSLDNGPVAYEYGFTYKGKYEAWRAGFDTRLDPVISVGKLLFSMLIERAFILGYQEIDFLRGDESYKLEWQPLTNKYTKARLIHKNHVLGQLNFNWVPRWKSLLKPSVLSSSTLAAWQKEED